MVYITGIAGALGSSLAKMFVNQGLEVVGNDIKRIEETPVKDLNLEYKWKAIQDLEPRDIEGHNSIFHCAAQPDRPLGTSSPSYTLSENIMGLTRVLECCRRTDIDKFIYPGSGTIFTGVPPEEQPITEETRPRPMGPYQASKYMDEVLCNTYKRCYGVPTAILRSGCVFGPGGRTDISIIRFIRRALKDEPIEVRSPAATRTFTYIENVLEYYSIIRRAEPELVVWNDPFHTVFPPEELEIIEMAKKVVEILNSNSEIREKGYEADEVTSSGDPVKQEIISTKDDILGVNPHISFEEGVKRTAEYFTEAGY